MRNILAIADKELRSYFASPIAYILIGMFWTKLGTSTGVAESGTVEPCVLLVKRKIRYITVGSIASQLGRCHEIAGI